MASVMLDEKAIFNVAREIASPEARAEYLRQACGSDSNLFERVQVLLRAYEGQASFLESPPVIGISQTIDQPAAETPGTIIGPYKLIESIGEGGMGTVWMAQQTEPVKRLVALKLIKAGMDSRQVIARFEAERQALALMDHANIARVLDAGTSDAGRPYFVMDLVKGVPITRYCDEHHLTPKQRLELFVPVCQAVQHAHQKGIIHRDLKPSNVLVALYDGKPVPKVIDFGVAKAAGQSLTDKTLVTGFGALVGTLEYMSPEQAEINQLDIDTRSDIYSLGVLLYELLTGSPPFTKKDLEKAGMLEMLRVIREQEPSKPSTKLSTAEGLPTLAANRGTEPARLTKLVRGELDWIVMKALEKDRNRRYETANGFAMDVQRYLADEAVQACPPSAGYRFKKFVRRNKGAVLAASLVLLTLLAGIAGTTYGLIRAENRRLEADQARAAEKDRADGERLAKQAAEEERDAKAKALAAETKALAAETKARQAEKKAREHALTALRAMTDEIVENQMARGTTLTEENKEFLRKIIKQFETFAAIPGDDTESRAIRAEGYYRVALMRYRLGELKAAESGYAVALAMWKQLAADFPTRPQFRGGLAASHNSLGTLLYTTGRLKEAESAWTDALAIRKQLAAKFPTRPEIRQDLAVSHNNLGALFCTTGRLKEAESAWSEALAIRKQLAAKFPTRPEFRRDLAVSLINLASLLLHTGRLKEAESANADALAIRKQLAADFPTRPEFRQDLARSLNNLGNLLYTTGRLKEAESAYAEALAIRKQLAADFPTRPEFRQDLAESHNFVGSVLNNTCRLKEAESAYAEAMAIQKQLAADFPTRPEFRQVLAISHNNLGNVLIKTGRLKEAESAYADALAIVKQLAAEFPTRPKFRQDLAISHNNRGALLGHTGRLKEAESALADAVAIQKQLIAEFPKVLDYQDVAARTLVELATLARRQGNSAAARKRLDEMLPYRQTYRHQLRGLTQTSAERGDRAGAVAAAQKGRDRRWYAPADAYDAAAALALCIPIVQKSERRADAPFYADEAMKMLRDAIAKGYHDTAHLKQDKDLDALRERADFKKLLAWLEEPGHVYWSDRHLYSTGFSPDSRYYYATGDADPAQKNTTRVWETATGKLMCEVVGNESAAFTPDSKRLLCAGPDKALHLYDLATGKEIRSFKGHTDWVATVAISPDGKRALSGSSDTTVRVWDLETGKELKKIAAHTTPSRALLAPDGKHFLTYSQNVDRKLRLWDAATYKEVRSWVAPGDNWLVAFAPDGLGFLTITYGDRTVHWWDLKKDKAVRSLKLAGNPLNAAGVSSDCRRLIYAVAKDNTIRLVDLGSGKEVARFEVPIVPMGLMAISPDGRFAAGASGNGWVYLWRLPPAAAEPPR
jgi:serine/threonine protein kinase